MKCKRCGEHKAQPLHYICKECYQKDDGEPMDPGERIILLEQILDKAIARIQELQLENKQLRHTLRYNPLQLNYHPNENP